MTTAPDNDGTYLDLKRSLPSDVNAISPFVDKLMLLMKECGCLSESDTDIEVALREALANAIVHGNQEDPRKRVHVTCRYVRDEVSIAVRDEGPGFELDKVPDPTAPENIGCVHGRGILMMKLAMDEVSFAHEGKEVRMRKKLGPQQGTSVEPA